MSDVALYKNLVRAMTGRDRPSALMTDGYKFSMAQAGFPLRDETFYGVLRKGGPHYIPWDVRDLIPLLLPTLPTAKEAAFLTANGYGMNPAMEKALQGTVKITGVPAGAWVLAGEPIYTVSGPSFLASWLEPLGIMLHFQIQVATALMKGMTEFTASCDDEASIILILASMLSKTVTVKVKQKEYEDAVLGSVISTRAALNGETHRAFEVGMRSVSCMEQHRIALSICQRYGINKTSNVFLAWEKYMIPVGTTGHEHQERWGSDLAGFRAIRDMRPEPPSYLFDTYDPILSGIPAMVKVVLECPGPCTARFDSGDQDEQFGIFMKEEEKSPVFRPNYIFEGDYNAVKTEVTELSCAIAGIPTSRRGYGYGGSIVSPVDWATPFKRDNVSAVYKLTRSGGRPCMKFSGTKGKESLPGKPVIFRHALLQQPDIIAQEGVGVPDGYTILTGDNTIGQATAPDRFVFGASTMVLVDILTAEKEKMIAGLKWGSSRFDRE